jgi:DNA-binding transcriptional LysR family regulator
MTLDQLHVFIAVAERQHVTRAAEHLHISQPSVSAAVRALEDRYGVALFHRVGRRIELTEAGRIFLDEARVLVAQAERTELVLSELGSMARGTLAIHASQTIASYWLPPHLSRFRRTHPGIGLRVGMGNTADVAKAVRDGVAELGFVEGAIPDPALVGEQVAIDRLVVVVGPHHPWAACAALHPDLMREGDWILREPGSGTRSEFEAALPRLGLTAEALRVVLELPSNESVRSAVELGAGATAISELAVTKSLQLGQLRQIGEPILERPFLAIVHRDRRPSRAAERLLALVRDGAVTGA